MAGEKDLLAVAAGSDSDSQSRRPWACFPSEFLSFPTKTATVTTTAAAAAKEQWERFQAALPWAWAVDPGDERDDGPWPCRGCVGREVAEETDVLAQGWGMSRMTHDQNSVALQNGRPMILVRDIAMKAVSARDVGGDSLRWQHSLTHTVVAQWHCPPAQAMSQR